MTTTYNRLKRRRDAGEVNGFTLIEIMIVIVVLGILAAVVIFALGGITSKSAVSACQADGATVSTALADFNNQNAGATATEATLLSGTAANGNNPYLQSWPSNSPHYAFGLSAGGVLLIEIPFTTAWNSAVPNTNGGTFPTGQPYTAPADCTTVQ